jgi:hypothetical protein
MPEDIVRHTEIIDRKKIGAKTDLKGVDSLLERHDQYNFEAKLDYTLHKDCKKSKYDVSIYFFIPRQLQINEKTYSRSKFYSDFTNYIRFRTPQMALSGINHENNSLSPLFRIRQYSEQVQNGSLSEEITQKIIYEFRILGSIYQSTIREQFQLYISEMTQTKDYSIVLIKILSYLGEIEKFRQQFLHIGNEMTASEVPLVVRDAYKLTEEYISLQTQEILTGHLKRFPEDTSEFHQVRTKMIDQIEFEIKHRRAINSNLIRDPNDDNESFTYWEGILKKFIQSVLYLNVQGKIEESKTLQVLYSLAAGIAMFISLLLGLWISQLFNQEFMYVLALVIAYMFKDRIKESIKNWSNKVVSHIFPDRRYEIIDSDGKNRIGFMRETMRFVRSEEVPPEIWQIRHGTDLVTLEQEGKPEKVLRYSKQVRIFTKKIFDIHPRHGDIFDIMRFNIRNMIEYADDPEHIDNVWNLQSKKVENVKCAKVYHLNLVLKLHAMDDGGHEQILYKRVRVILDQRGIKRLQEPMIQI